MCVLVVIYIYKIYSASKTKCDLSIARLILVAFGFYSVSLFWLHAGSQCIIRFLPNTSFFDVSRAIGLMWLATIRLRSDLKHIRLLLLCLAGCFGKDMARPDIELGTPGS